MFWLNNLLSREGFAFEELFDEKHIIFSIITLFEAHVYVGVYPNFVLGYFVKSFYKALLGKKVTLEDLESVVSNFDRA